ncbi:MAG: glutamate synthase subunit beta [Candidatus Omnitrophica bacterium]|nr:glutamate synthase subunit beta [Candidatus Omnitrophota bacterium]
MADIRGFLKVKRSETKYRPICERIKDFAAVNVLPEATHAQEQASRCMDCGTPFCHWGCPIGNYISEWNDFIFKGQWQQAFQLLQATNNFPEITARVCPAQCEYACVLGINDEPVTIKENELAIIEWAFRQGIVRPNPPTKRTGKKVAVIGSGPAGLACADQLNKAGHLVVVFEKADKIGGILRYGIPDFKLEKWVLERRINLLKKEGIIFNTNVYVGQELKFKYLQKEFEAICLATGASLPRDLKIEGRNLSGIHFAMDYLIQANRRVAGEKIAAPDLIDGSTSLTINPERAKRAEWIDAKEKKVVVIGGGDTGADCVGVAHRQGACSITQIELLPKPAECRTQDFPWPYYPMILKTSTSHEEGGRREWSVSTRKFTGENGWVKKLICQRIGQKSSDSEFEIEADLVLLALGFLYPQRSGLIKELALDLDSRGNVLTDPGFMTAKKGIFSCGDMHRGQSLVVWAIAEGRQAAHFIDKTLFHLRGGMRFY